MNSHYTFETRPGYLYMNITGEYEQGEFIAYPKIIADACEKEKMNKVLVNGLNLQGTDVSTLDRFFVGESIANFLGTKIKIAVAWPGQHINNFAETVALNRGSFIRVVGDLDAAKEWLLNDN